MAQDMDQTDYALQENLSLNLRFIRELWKAEKTELGDGDGSLKDKKQNFNNMYGILELHRSEFQKRIFSEYDYKENIINKWAKRISAKTGICEDYLTGKKKIFINDKYSEKVERAFGKFDDEYDKMGNILDKARKNPLYWSTKRMKNYIKKQSEEKQDNFKKYIGDAEEMLNALAELDNTIQEEAVNLKKKDLACIKKEYNDEVYRLVYFIRENKKCGEMGVKEIIEIMDKIHTLQIKLLGKEGIENYIKVLEKQLDLVKSVYTVCIDLKEFEKK